MTTSSSALQPGSLIGDLQINAILGVGTFGITYLVTDPAIGTRFALKEYLPSKHVSRQKNGKVVPNDEQSKQIFAAGLKLFLTEARLVAALDHPNVVKVLRYFEANSTAYFLMPYYQGQPLHHLLEAKGTFDRDNARALMLPLMNALEYVHKQGIVHQDIKPANIYMTQSDGPILLDFGVAAADTDGSHKLGSEGYAAPEQAEAHDLIGPWTDIYGLAATLYRCVTGRIPTAAATRQEVISNGAADPLTPFPELAPAEKYGGLTDAVELGLKVQPQERPRDVGAWKKSFKSLDWHRSVVVGGSTETYAKERKEWLPTILFGIFLVVMTAIGIFLLTDESPEQASTDTTTVTDDVASSNQLTTRVQEPTSKELGRWQGALKADTVLGYRSFIADFPESITGRRLKRNWIFLMKKPGRNYRQKTAYRPMKITWKCFLTVFTRPKPCNVLMPSSKPRRKGNVKDWSVKDWKIWLGKRPSTHGQSRHSINTLLNGQQVYILKRPNEYAACYKISPMTIKPSIQH